ncbi:MAG: hypothetical protein A3J12_05500 [Omnitrophica bacterium RIFCSPLOWO2_02_FULL_44_11]|nr:MAG: hypothetical protein A3J12_05500 [Omnitrophica bacterium RIFCSPLOWO2_02_FULL_44_11]
MDALQGTKNPQFTSVLLKIIQRKNESKAIMGRAFQLLETTGGPEAAGKLKQILLSPQLPSKTRELALYTLSRRDPAGIKKELLQIVENIKEPSPLRTLAVAELNSNPDDAFLNIAGKIIRNKKEPDIMRASALSVLEQTAFFIDDPSALTNIIRDSAAGESFRQSAFEIASKLLPATEIQTLLTELCSNKKNPIEMRRYALNQLEHSKDSSILSYFKDLLVNETDAAFAADLRNLIAQLEKPEEEKTPSKPSPKK